MRTPSQNRKNFSSWKIKQSVLAGTSGKALTHRASHGHTWWEINQEIRHLWPLWYTSVLVSLNFVKFVKINIHHLKYSPFQEKLIVTVVFLLLYHIYSGQIFSGDNNPPLWIRVQDRKQSRLTLSRFFYRWCGHQKDRVSQVDESEK